MTDLGIQAITLESESLKVATDKGVNVFKEIAAGQYSIIIASPERLSMAEFDKILRNATFQENLVLLFVDEAHLVVPWGEEFRLSYAQVPRLRTRIPQGIPTALVTATSRPGKGEDDLLKMFGFKNCNSKRIRHNDARTNIALAYITLTHGLDKYDFPDIAWVAKNREKTIIYCRSYKLCSRVTSYLQRLLPADGRRNQRIRQYHSVIWSDENLETLRMFCEGSLCFCVVATIKFGLGMNVRSVRVCINFGLPDSPEKDKQQHGRAGRDRRVDAVGVTYVEKMIAADVDNEVSDDGDEDDGSKSDSEIQDRRARNQRKRTLNVRRFGDDIQPVVERKRAVRRLDKGMRAMVRSHVKRRCLVVTSNQIFGDSGGLSHVTCLEAQRRLPCSSCLAHSAYTSLRTTTTLPMPELPAVFLPASSSSARPTSTTASSQLIVQDSHPKLTQAMRKDAESSLHRFARTHWLRKSGEVRFQYLPYVCFIPGNILHSILSHFHNIRSLESLEQLLDNWEFKETDAMTLFELIMALNARYDAERERTKKESIVKAQETRRRNKAALTTSTTRELTLMIIRISF